VRALTAQAFAGTPTGTPAFDALGVVARETGLTPAMAEDVIAGFALDVTDWHPREEADLMRYCWHVAGAVGVMMAVVMGVSPRDEDTLDRAADLGLAFQLANIARDLAEDDAAGRCYLPAQWLADADIPPASSSSRLIGPFWPGSPQGCAIWHGRTRIPRGSARRGCAFASAGPFWPQQGSMARLPGRWRRGEHARGTAGRGFRAGPSWAGSGGHWFRPRCRCRGGATRARKGGGLPGVLLCEGPGTRPGPSTPSTQFQRISTSSSAIEGCSATVASKSALVSPALTAMAAP
jgi:hypothetical protein